MALRGGLVLLVVALAAMATVVRSTDHDVYFGLGALRARVDGHGLVADVLDDEMLMESESARRELTGGGHISYGALRRNNVPCNQRGRSYYNCRGHQKANPYQRGCTRASRCARSNR